jgi:hypothetical protein
MASVKRLNCASSGPTCVFLQPTGRPAPVGDQTELLARPKRSVREQHFHGAPSTDHPHQRDHGVVQKDPPSPGV